MTLSPGLRKLVRTAHVAVTVAWLGSVVCFLALAIAGLMSTDLEAVRASYISMGLIAQFVIVPLSLAPLVTGPVLSLGTPWGLFRHYWIVFKLAITVLAALALTLHMQPISGLAAAAMESPLSNSDLRELRTQLVIYAVAALLALLVATGLAVYKPRGLTPYGWSRQIPAGKHRKPDEGGS